MSSENFVANERKMAASKEQRIPRTWVGVICYGYDRTVYRSGTAPSVLYFRLHTHLWSL